MLVQALTRKSIYNQGLAYNDNSTVQVRIKTTRYHFFIAVLTTRYWTKLSQLKPVHILLISLWLICYYNFACLHTANLLQDCWTSHTVIPWTGQNFLKNKDQVTASLYSSSCNFLRLWHARTHVHAHTRGFPSMALRKRWN